MALWQASATMTTMAIPSDGFNYELKAPGTDMLSTIPGGKYKALNGTSMAAPLVAGSISALMMVKNYDSQEILWGDLLHTDNIAQAYAVTNRPAELDLMKIMYRERKELADETEDDYSNDGEIDAGETVSLYPVIRTTFGAASNIQMKLEMGDEFEDPNTVEILTPGWVDFGLHLDAYGRGVSLNPMQLRVASNVADSRHIKMKFTAKCDETNVQYVGTFTLKVTNMVKISGVISEDLTLYAGKKYLVNKNLAVPEGTTLTIEPGSTVVFGENTGLSCEGQLIAVGTPEKKIVLTGHNGNYWKGVSAPSGTIEYCDISYVKDDILRSGLNGIFKNCVLSNVVFSAGTLWNNMTNDKLKLLTSNLFDCSGYGTSITNIKHTNVVDNNFENGSPNWWYGQNWEDLSYCNYLCNNNVGGYSVGYMSETPIVISSETPSYLGTASVQKAKQSVYDIHNSDFTFAELNLNNMATRPYSEAHGIVWKVCVNGKDAQDEYEDLAPLGVGKHKSTASTASMSMVLRIKSTSRFLTRRRASTS